MQNTGASESPQGGIFKKPSRIPAKYGTGKCTSGNNSTVSKLPPRSCENRKTKPVSLSAREHKKLQDAQAKLIDLNESVLQLEGKLNNFTGRKDEHAIELLDTGRRQQFEVVLGQFYDSGVRKCAQFMELNRKLLDEHTLLGPAWRQKLQTSIAEMAELLDAMQVDRDAYVHRFVGQFEQLTNAHSEEYDRQHVVDKLKVHFNSLTSELAGLRMTDATITASIDDATKKDHMIAELNEKFVRLTEEITKLARPQNASSVCELRQQLELAHNQLSDSSAELQKLQDQLVALESEHTATNSELLERLALEKMQRQEVLLEWERAKKLGQMAHCGDHSAAGNVYNEAVQMQATIEKLCNEKNSMQASSVILKAQHDRLQAQLQENELSLHCSDARIRELEQQLFLLQQNFADAENMHLNEIDAFNSTAANDALLVQKLQTALAIVQHRLVEHTQQADVDIQLLRARSTLIDDMQRHEDAMRQQLKLQSIEMATRAEEVQNILATLHAKDMELARQCERIAELEMERKCDKRTAIEMQAKIIQQSSENALLKRHFHEIMNIDQFS